MASCPNLIVETGRKIAWPPPCVISFRALGSMPLASCTLSEAEVNVTTMTRHPSLRSATIKKKLSQVDILGS